MVCTFSSQLKMMLHIIRTRMVSDFKLARRREIVSQPPEKMCSTATAEPKTKVPVSWKNMMHKIITVPRMESMSFASKDSVGNWDTCAAHHLLGLHLLKFSWGTLRKASNLLTMVAVITYQEVKSTFWGLSDVKVEWQGGLEGAVEGAAGVM